MLKSFLLASACLLAAGAADAASTIVQTTSAAWGPHGGSYFGTINQYNGLIYKVQIDLTGGGSATSYYPGTDPIGVAVSGLVGGYFTDGVSSVSAYGSTTAGGGSCSDGLCIGLLNASYSKTLTGSDLALFMGTGTLTYWDSSDIVVSFLPEFQSTGSTAKVTYFLDATDPGHLDAPEPGTWMMLLAGFGAVGFAMRRPQKVSFA